jgi:hypothetical protein
MKLTEERRQKIVEDWRVRDALEPDETVEALTITQTKVPAWAAPIAGLIGARAQPVVVTQRNIYALEKGMGKTSAPRPVFKHPLGSVDVTLRGGKLEVGPEKRYVLVGFKDSAAEVVSVADAGRQGGAAAA